jgi:hypothetical protein
MTLREAAQQALEALYMANTRQWPENKIGAAINTLNAALAEPDYWEEEAKRYAGNADFWRSKYKALAQPVQKSSRKTVGRSNRR